MNPDLLISELEHMLERVNAELKKILPHITNSDLRKALQKVERLSRFRRGFFETDSGGLEYATNKAKLKAQEYGEPFVVAVKEGAMVLIPKSRLLKDRPFGLTLKDVVFEAGVGKK